MLQANTNVHTATREHPGRNHSCMNAALLNWPAFPVYFCPFSQHISSDTAVYSVVSQPASLSVSILKSTHLGMVRITALIKWLYALLI